MRLFLTTFSIIISFNIIAAKVTLEVRNAFDNSPVFDAEIEIFYEALNLSRTFSLTKDGTFTFKVRKPVSVTARISDDRYFGQSVYLTREDNGTYQTAYIYPNREHDQTLLKEAGCSITEKKSLSTLEKESEKLSEVEGKDLPDGDAEFPGGDDELKVYLGNSIRYPQFSMNIGEEAKVYIEFIVNKDGSISCAQSKNKVPLHIMAESLRVVRNMPKWNPAKLDGENVRARCRIPINFKLQ